MSFKLDLINRELPLTGNDVVATEDDGSAEWVVASAAYEEGLKYLLGVHDWKFATSIVTPTRVGDPSDENYTDAYARPTGALGIVWVKVGGISVDWRIVGNQIFVNADDAVTVKIVTIPVSDAFNPLFVNALQCLVRAGIEGGLNEDKNEARALRKEAELYIEQARSKSDREEAPRPMFVSSMLARRRGRVTSQ